MKILFLPAGEDGMRMRQEAVGEKNCLKVSTVFGGSVNGKVPWRAV